MSDDPFDAVFRGALHDGALDPERLEAFARGLRERALKILEERVRPLEDKAAAVEREAEWRKANEASLASELEWRKANEASLASELEWRKANEASLASELEWSRTARQAQDREVAWLREQIERLDATLAAVDRERRAASSAHDRLLEHHRHVVGDLLTALDRLSSGLPWHPGRVREEIARLAEALKKELG